MVIYHAGGGTLGKQNFLHEMYYYAAGNDAWPKQKQKQKEMLLYFAGTDLHTKTDSEYEMNFYAAGKGFVGDKYNCSANDLKNGLRNRLLSFADVNLVEGAFKFWLNPQLKEKKVFIDSGAFSAASRGAKIDLQAYCEWLKEHLSEITVYACLDVIGDWRASLKNQEYMEAQGLKPILAFHYASPLSELERICRTYDYFAFGGMVPVARKRNEMIAWLDKCFTVIKKFWPKKIHCFGVTAQPIIERYPFYSCDSTAAIMGGGMGRVMDFKHGKLTHSDWVEELKDGKYQTADKNGKSGHLDRRMHNIRAMVQFERYITALWEKRGIIWHD